MKKKINIERIAKVSLEFYFITIISVPVVILAACQNNDTPIYSAEKEDILYGQTTADTSAPKGRITYDLDNPNRCPLPYSLVEISALTMGKDSNILYALNDEKGLIYKLKDCEVLERIDFGKNGDYEGIERIQNTIYTIRSNGKLFAYNLDDQSTEKLPDNELNSSNDVEGLGYDADSNYLLIACKGSPEIKKHQKLKKTKAVYAFDLNKEEFTEEPFMLITDKALEKFLKTYLNRDLKKSRRKRLIKRALNFAPSAIAKNPVDGHYYLLSALGNTMIIVNQHKEVIDINFLDHPNFIQPEGICFDRDGTLYISNEGKKLIGNVLKFNFR